MIIVASPPNHCLRVYFWQSWPWFCGSHFLIRTSLKAKSEPSLMRQSLRSDLGRLLTVKEEKRMVIEEKTEQQWFSQFSQFSQFASHVTPIGPCSVSLWLHHASLLGSQTNDGWLLLGSSWAFSSKENKAGEGSIHTAASLFQNCPGLWLFDQLDWNKGKW